MSAFDAFLQHTEPLLILAPMAGVTEPAFRQLCLSLGADLAVSEMVKAQQPEQLANPDRSRFAPQTSVRVIQIVGNQPAQMAATARQCEALGADAVDVNLGCPAKKFARKPAGSALMANPASVRAILQAVIAATSVPVTVKMRTGVTAAQRNACDIALMAQDLGIRAVTVHGRTREQKFRGQAEHDTTATLVEALDIPVFANGDIESPDQARQVLNHTGAAGLMIGRAARRNPWVFLQLRHYLRHGLPPPAVTAAQRLESLQQHLNTLQRLYPSEKALMLAKKQLSWWAASLGDASQIRQQLAVATTLDTLRQNLPQPVRQGAVPPPA